ncbi:MAG: hypothetical protein QOJ60_818 [Actinomycetota bacterium]|nr:hypothetical protein [Actinomycetota bacterium]
MATFVVTDSSGQVVLREAGSVAASAAGDVAVLAGGAAATRDTEGMVHSPEDTVGFRLRPAVPLYDPRSFGSGLRIGESIRAGPGTGTTADVRIVSVVAALKRTGSVVDPVSTGCMSHRGSCHERAGRPAADSDRIARVVSRLSGFVAMVGWPSVDGERRAAANGDCTSRPSSPCAIGVRRQWACRHRVAHRLPTGPRVRRSPARCRCAQAHQDDGAARTHPCHRGHHVRVAVGAQPDPARPRDREVRFVS